ncbi:MAG: hypothetical protein ACP5D2_00555 [Candidatus Nanoarchaeia archaeon]
MKKTTIKQDKEEPHEEESLSNEEIRDIKIALENVKKGKLKPIEQVIKELKAILH